MQLTPRTPGDLHPKDNHNIIENLPEFIKLGCRQFSDPKEQELFLMAALGVLSGCLPKYIGYYDGLRLAPHLYFIFLAPYGTGKGTMKFARYLAEAIHKAKRKRTKDALAAYLKETKPRRKKGETDNSDSSAMPPNEMLFIPADSSKSALIDGLNDNNGYGIIFETEADTLRAALKLDYAAFLDVLLKAFHHEALTFQRRAGKEYKEVLNPCLAVIMSSTYDQFLHLVPSKANGLVSRFAYYLLPEDKGFKNVFSSEKRHLIDHFVAMGLMVEHKYNALFRKTEPIYFHFTHHQEETFMAYFGQVKAEAEGEIGGSINRLAVICFRIAMVLAYFRFYDRSRDHEPPEAVWCQDIDFTNALAITMLLQEHMETLYTFLPDTGKGRAPGSKQMFYVALPDEEFTADEAKKIGEKCGISSRTVERYLKDDKLFERIGQGKYRKVK